MKYAMSSTDSKIALLEKRLDELWARGFNVEVLKGALYYRKQLRGEK